MLMKFLNKTAVKRILLILLCALVVLPFILDLIKVDVKEGFSDTPKAASDYESNNLKINRIITAKGANFDGTNSEMTDADVSYAYCISAQDTDIKCKTGNLDVSYPDLSFLYGDGLIGKTYDASCHLLTMGTKLLAHRLSVLQLVVASNINLWSPIKCRNEPIWSFRRYGIRINRFI